MLESSAAKRRAASPLTNPVRLVIVVAERLLGEALGALLDREPGLRVVGAAVTGLDAVAIVDAEKPDVVLLDPGLPEIDYVDVIRLVVRQAPAAKVLLLTMRRDGSEICRALRAGAKGYVSKNAGVPAVTEAIEALHRGEMWVEPTLIAEALWGKGPVATGAAAARAD